jgi:hypothetical protein
MRDEIARRRLSAGTRDSDGLAVSGARFDEMMTDDMLASSFTT